jgi:hypothetical protein
LEENNASGEVALAPELKLRWPPKLLQPSTVRAAARVRALQLAVQEPLRAWAVPLPRQQEHYGQARGCDCFHLTKTPQGLH